MLIQAKRKEDKDLVEIRQMEHRIREMIEKHCLILAL